MVEPHAVASRAAHCRVVTHAVYGRSLVAADRLSPAQFTARPRKTPSIVHSIAARPTSKSAPIGVWACSQQTLLRKSGQGMSQPERGVPRTAV